MTPEERARGKIRPGVLSFSSHTSWSRTQSRRSCRQSELDSESMSTGASRSRRGGNPCHGESSHSQRSWRHQRGELGSDSFASGATRIQRQCWLASWARRRRGGNADFLAGRGIDRGDAGLPAGRVMDEDDVIWERRKRCRLAGWRRTSNAQGGGRGRPLERTRGTPALEEDDEHAQGGG